MKRMVRTAIFLAAALSLSVSGLAQEKKPPGTASKSQAAVDKALDLAMTPGAGQQRLNAMVGSFDIKIKTWVYPDQPPVESSATCVTTWVLGNRYVQMVIEGTEKEDPFKGIGYFGFDNTTNTYQATWMDNGSTGMYWYTGGLDSSGKRATMKASVISPVTGKASPLEMRVTIDEQGNHVTELWGTGLGTKMFKLMELNYTKK